MNKPFAHHNKTSKLQAYGWQIISLIDEQTKRVENEAEEQLLAYRERVVSACLSLMPELRLATTYHSVVHVRGELQDSHATTALQGLQRKIDSLISHLRRLQGSNEEETEEVGSFLFIVVFWKY
jgi:hypothetical protein